MSRVSVRLRWFHLALAISAFATPALSVAAVPSGPPSSELLTQIFIAPSGEPFRSAAGEPYPVAAWFAGADTSHDGKLTEVEFVIDASRFFKTLDLDQNEQLTGVEIKRYENDVAPEVRTGTFESIDWKVNGARGRGGRARALGLLQVQTDDLTSHVPEVWNRKKDTYVGSGAAKYGIIAIPEPVMGMDTDLNGIVTKREMVSAAQRRFRVLDSDNRNYLLLAELPETYAQSHAPKKRKR